MRIPDGLKRFALPGVTAAVLVAISIIAPHEGELHHAYQDSIGVWTICRGHTQGVKEGDVATQAQCDKWFTEDLAIAERAYDRLVSYPHNDNVKAAMISFIFNAGEGNFRKSTMLKLLNQGKKVQACQQLPRWKYAGGRDCTIRSNNCTGLIKRRQDEMNLCLKETRLP